MNVTPGNRVTDAYRCFNAGLSLRATARVTGLANNTVRRIYMQTSPLLCPCGKPITHRGWCGHRVSLSPRRQLYLSNTRPIRVSTTERWKNNAQKVTLFLENGGSPLASIDHDAMRALARFYNPNPMFGFENDRLIQAVSATQENSSLHLMGAIQRLPEKLRIFVEGILDDLTPAEAAVEALICPSKIEEVLKILRRDLAAFVK